MTKNNVLNLQAPGSDKVAYTKMREKDIQANAFKDVFPDPREYQMMAKYMVDACDSE